MRVYDSIQRAGTKKKKNGDKWYILEYFVGRRRRWRWKTKIATTTNFGVYKVFFKRVISIVKGNNEERREEIRWWDKIRIRIVVFLFLFLRIHCSIRFNFSSTKRIRSFYVYIYICISLSLTRCSRSFSLVVIGKCAREIIGTLQHY